MAISLALDVPAETSAAASPERAPGLVLAGAGADMPRLPEEVWLRAVKAASPHSDILARYGGRIFVTSTGRFYVPTANDRAEILSLQSTPAIATRVLAAATIEFRTELAQASGHQPTRAALLIAHLYGTASALSYLQALEGAPQRPAIAAVPQLAEAWGPSSREPLAKLDARVSAELGARAPAVADAASSAAGGAASGAATQMQRGHPNGVAVPNKLMLGTLTRPETHSANTLAQR